MPKSIIMLISFIIILFSSVCSADDSNIIVFVSFSMPDASIKGWMQEAKKIHAPIVIRGLINNSFKQTTKKMAELVKDQNGGVELNPVLFEKFQIEKVPAVVVTDKPRCSSIADCMGHYDVIFGDVELEYALKKFAAQKNTFSPIAAAALEKMK